MADKVSKPAAALLEVSVEKEPPSPLPVPSMEDKKQPVPLVAMAVVLDVNVKLDPPPTPAPMDKKKEKPPAVVLFVCLWALANAVSFAGNAVASLIMNRNPCNKSTWWFRCAEVTDAAAAEATALWRGQLWCAAPQAAAAALALVLAARGRRWSRRWAVALAFVALAATAGGHYMEFRVDRIFLAAAPGDAYITTDVVGDFVLVVLDLLGFFCLVIQLGDGGDE